MEKKINSELVIVCFYNLKDKTFFRARNEFWYKNNFKENFAYKIKDKQVTSKVGSFSMMELVVVNNKRINLNQLIPLYDTIFIDRKRNAIPS